MLTQTAKIIIATAAGVAAGIGVVVGAKKGIEVYQAKHPVRQRTACTDDEVHTRVQEQQTAQAPA